MTQNIDPGTLGLRGLAVALSAAWMSVGCSNPLGGDAGPLPCVAATPNSNAPSCAYRVLETYPHDPNAFTQGLIYFNGVLYEGTGLYSQSSLREVDLDTGKVVRLEALSDEYFGEGITLHDGRIIQLTWRSRLGFVYDQSSFDRLAQFSYPTEGWGITHDGDRLIMSDGTATLRFLDPYSFEARGSVEVSDLGSPVVGLNELEFIRGEIYANVLPTDQIVRISLETGAVIGWIDLTGLLGEEERGMGSGPLNGIAFDSRKGHLLVTGKRWPTLFRIELLSP